VRGDPVRKIEFKISGLVVERTDAPPVPISKTKASPLRGSTGTAGFVG